MPTTLPAHTARARSPNVAFVLFALLLWAISLMVLSADSSGSSDAIAALAGVSP